MRIVAFDFGLRHVGVAVGNTETGTATPQKALHAVNGAVKPDELRKLLSAWQPQVCVVGLPLNMDGSEQDMTARARAFAAKLKPFFSGEVAFVDERLSSAAAKEEIFAKGGFRALASDKDRVDSVSAGLLLEQYLAQGRRDGR